MVSKMLHSHYSTHRQMVIPQWLKPCHKPGNFIRWFKGGSILKNLVSAMRRLQLSSRPQVPLEMEVDPFSQSRRSWGEKKGGSVLAGAQLSQRQTPLWKRETHAQVGWFSVLEMLTRFFCLIFAFTPVKSKLRDFHVWYWTHTFALGICVL